MSNVTAKPGQRASFKCQVDMSCIVAYIEWYHEMDNGTLKLIKVSQKYCSKELCVKVMKLSSLSSERPFHNCYVDVSAGAKPLTPINFR